MVNIKTKKEDKYVSVYDLRKESKSIDVNQLLVFCELQEEYEEFIKDLEQLIKSKYRRNKIDSAYKAMRGYFTIYQHKYKEFISKHKHAIEVMEKYNCISNLTLYKYDGFGDKQLFSTTDDFYNLVKNNKDKIEQLKALLIKLQELGIDKIYYGKDLDFTKYTYEYEVNPFASGSYFSYLENMEVYPGYIQDPIKYGTTSSAYCINLEKKSNSNEISKYSREIYLNDLFIDQNRLPESITFKTTAQRIIDLAKQKINDYKLVEEIVDLNVGISDFKNQYDELKKKLEKVDTIKDKKELIEIMEELNTLLEKIRTIKDKHEDSIIESTEEITKEQIEKEKQLYLQRRYLSSIDVD